jgi:hypothetical protein
MGIKGPSGGWAEVRTAARQRRARRRSGRQPRLEDRRAEARPSYRAFGDFVEDFGHLAEGLSAATEGKRQ